MMATVQIMCARVGMVTGKGLAGTFRHKIPKPLLGAVAVLVTCALAQKINLSIGVVGHEGSTVLVVLNGLRLLRLKPGRDA